MAQQTTGGQAAGVTHLINTAPFVEAHFNLGLSARATKEAAAAAKRFFRFLQEQRTSFMMASYCFDPWSSAMLKDMAPYSAKHPNATAAYFAAKQKLTRQVLETEKNVVLPLRITGATEYEEAFEQAIEVASKAVGSGTTTWAESSNATTAAAAEVEAQRVKLVANFKATTTKYNSEFADELWQLNIYRKSLGLVAITPPSKLVDNTGTVIGLSVAAGLLLLAALGYGIYVAVKRLRAMARAQREHKERLIGLVREAVGTTKVLHYPVNLVRTSDFIGACQLVQHETLRDQGKLIVIDGLMEAYSFATQRPIVFFSHQWTAFASPDHTNKQYEMMVTSLRTICEKKGWDLDSVVVWVDFSCIPQVHRGLQGLAIHSLAAYASAASAFVVVAPALQHKDLPGVQCDEDSYRTRMWCRAEQLCHSLRNGVDDMWVANDTSCLPMKSDWFDEALYVFHGEATCCRLKHKNMSKCDRETLVLPILGLFGEMYASKSVPGEQKKLWDERIAANKDRMFPAEFTFKHHKANEERVLFGPLVSMMEELIDTDQSIGAHLLGSSKQGARCKSFLRTHSFSDGPVHGAPINSGGTVHGMQSAMPRENSIMKEGEAVASSAIVPVEEKDIEMQI